MTKKDETLNLDNLPFPETKDLENSEEFELEPEYFKEYDFNFTGKINDCYINVGSDKLEGLLKTVELLLKDN